MCLEGCGQSGLTLGGKLALEASCGGGTQGSGCIETCTSGATSRSSKTGASAGRATNTCTARHTEVGHETSKTVHARTGSSTDTCTRTGTNTSVTGRTDTSRAVSSTGGRTSNTGEEAEGTAGNSRVVIAASSNVSRSSSGQGGESSDSVSVSDHVCGC